MESDKILTPGEWEALLWQVPDQVRPLVYRLAIHHGAIEPPRPAECQVCSPKRQGVLKYSASVPQEPEGKSE